MNEIAKLQANTLVNTAKNRGLYCQVREVNTGGVKLNKSGMYVMFGMDEETVNSFARKDADGLYELARSQAVEHGTIYPKCQIIQLTDSNSMVQAADALDYMIGLEFLRDQAKELGVKTLRSQMQYATVLLASYYYREALEYPEVVRETAMKSCNMLFEYFGSKYNTIEEFFEHNKQYRTKDTGMFTYATGNIYNATGEYHVPIESLFHAGDRKVCASNIQEKDLPELEKMLCAKKIHYHIKPECRISDNYGEPVDENSKKIFKNGPKARVWHTIYYDEAYDNLINGWYAARYYTNLKDHVKSLSYDPNGPYMPVVVPAAWIENVTNYLNDIHANYYFDVNCAYAPTTLETIGLVVDNKTDLQRIATAITSVIQGKQTYKEIDRVLEKASLGKGKEKQDALAELERRKNTKSLTASQER